MEIRLFQNIPNYITFRIHDVKSPIKHAFISVMDRVGIAYHKSDSIQIDNLNNVLTFTVDKFQKPGTYVLDLTVSFDDNDYVKQYILRVTPPPPGVVHYYHEFEAFYEKTVRAGIYNMTGLQPSSGARELQNLRGFFNEATNIYGTDAELYLIDKYEYDAVSDPKIVYHRPLLTKILFDDRPRIRTLESLGWFHNDSEIIPLIIHVPRVLDTGEDVRLMSWCYLKFQNMLHEVNETEFLISKFRSSDIYPIYWMATIVPKSSVYEHKISIEGRNLLNRNKPLIVDNTDVVEKTEVVYKESDRPLTDTHSSKEPVFFKY